MSFAASRMVRASSGESAPETSSAAATEGAPSQGLPRVSSSGTGQLRTRSESDTLKVEWSSVPIPRITRPGLLRWTLRLTASYRGLTHSFHAHRHVVDIERPPQPLHPGP